MSRFCSCLSLALVLLLQSEARAWDSVGHRLSAAVAISFLEPRTRDELLGILAGHPRYQQDFIAQMPAFVADGATLQAQWLLGQAAFWPDLARGLPRAERDRYNRANWHYSDGAWLRGAAALDGNVYLDMAPLPGIAGTAAAEIRTESQADNVVTALDYNARVLADPAMPTGARAVALCWLLHLVADIHQPLHTGSLYSPALFDRGDRGGNAIPLADNENLHGLWDRALRAGGIAQNLTLVLEQLSTAGQPPIAEISADWSGWMSESRQLLATVVYDDVIQDAIRRAEASGSGLQPIQLSPDYVQRMQSLARQRIGLAGLRLAAWFENELP